MTIVVVCYTRIFLIVAPTQLSDLTGKLIRIGLNNFMARMMP